MASTIDEYVYSPEDKLVAGEVNDGQRFTEEEMNRRVIIPEREESRVKELLSEIDQAKGDCFLRHTSPRSHGARLHQSA